MAEDLFHPDVPFDFVDQVFAVMALTPRHTYQVLTKRPERMAEYLNDETLHSVGGALCAGRGEAIALRMYERDPSAPDVAWPLPNVLLGTSVEDHAAADERIPHLLRCPAAVRFLSCEPLLGPVDLRNVGNGHDALTSTCCPWAEDYPIAEDPCPPCRDGMGVSVDWVIAGGESGAGARPSYLTWFRSLRDQCREAGVPFFLKQLGAFVLGSGLDDEPLFGLGARFEWTGHGVASYRVRFHDPKGGDPSEWPEDLRVREYPEVTHG